MFPPYLYQLTYTYESLHIHTYLNTLISVYTYAYTYKKFDQPSGVWREAYKRAFHIVYTYAHVYMGFNKEETRNKRRVNKSSK